MNVLVKSGCLYNNYVDEIKIKHDTIYLKWLFLVLLFLILLFEWNFQKNKKRSTGLYKLPRS